MRPIGEALGEILPAFAPLARERSPLLEARGLFVAEDVRARFDLPPFDNSAMDGYAVRHQDVQGASAETPVTLPVAGESRAGGDLPGEHQPGTAMRIFTGAPLPPGADAVVMQEDTQRDGEQVSLQIAPTAWRHVRRLASDMQAGQVVLRAGDRLGPGELGLLASQNHASVTVWRRPRVALLSTGDELRDASDPPRPGSIVNSNAYALAAQVHEAGGVPWILPIAPDAPEPILAAVREGLQADVLVSIGGVSVGDYDLVNAAFAAAGVEQRFWKIAMKPGKPVSFGLAGGVPVLGLPGNPVSAMVTFEVFVRPGLRRMLGDPRPHRSRTEVRLAHDHRHKTGRTELARATLSRGPLGLNADLRRAQGSGSLPSMVGVDAFVILPADQADFAAGDSLSAILLAGHPGASEPPF
jgi:molybdopterin molybdotransferase